MKYQDLFSAFRDSREMQRRLKGFLEKKEKAKLRLCGFFSFISILFDLLSLSMLLPILNAAAGGTNLDFLSVQLGVLGIAFLGKSGFEMIRAWLSNGYSQDAAQIWAVKMYRLFCGENLQEHNQTTAMQQVTAVRTDSEACARVLISFANLKVNVAVLIGYFMAASFVVQREGVLLGLCILLIGMKVYWDNRRRILEFGERRRQSGIKEASLITIAYGSYKEIKLDTNAENLIKKYDCISKKYAKLHKEYTFMKEMARIVLSNIIQAFLLFAAAFLLMAGISQRFLAAKLLSSLTFLVYLIPRTNQLLSELINIQYAQKNCDTFCKNMEKYERMRKKEKEAALLRKKKIDFVKGLRIENLSFHYPNGTDILKNVSMEVPAGSSVAIVGKSGAGKTTLLDLLLGLIEPQSGHIWYDDYELIEGRDEQGLCRGEIGRIISYIPQLVHLNDTSICSNVVFLEKEEDRERVVDCLKRARIWEDIEKLPRGIDTVLGENGFAISMGQRQRIVLARALYKNSRFLVMDEMTAALDRETERELMQSLKNLQGNRTLLLVTHHEELAKECEIIYQLENQQLTRIR